MPDPRLPFWNPDSGGAGGLLMAFFLFFLFACGWLMAEWFYG